MTGFEPTWTILRRAGAAALCIAALAAAVWFASFSAPRAEAAGGGAGLYSIELSEMTIPEAMKRLNEATGVPIVVRKGTEKKISARSYANQDLDHILKDLLRHADHVVRWNYLDDALTSVDIWIFDRPLPGKPDGAESPASFQPSERAGVTPKLKSAMTAPHNRHDASERRRNHPVMLKMPPVAPATRGQEGEPADSDAQPGAEASIKDERPDQTSEAPQPAEEKEEAQSGGEKEERTN